MASSADGTNCLRRLFSVTCTLNQFRHNLTQRQAVQYWRSIVASADGTKLVATDIGSTLIHLHRMPHHLTVRLLGKECWEWLLS